jgi:phosphopantothenoylcysteine synthetase/decarboxylase
VTGLCTVVLCGAPLASRGADIAAGLIASGWRVQLVSTPAAAAWLDPAALQRVAGHVPRSLFRQPDQPRQDGIPDAVVAVPATFNTVNKLAGGIADTYAHSVLAEALASRVPLVLVPMVSTRLWGHPVWSANLSLLGNAGVTFVDIRTGHTVAAPVPSGTGERVVEEFDPQWVTTAIQRVVDDS